MSRTATELRLDPKINEPYLQRHILQAQAYGNATATHLFISMLNPKMRGEKFTWERFADIAERHAEVTAWQGFSEWAYRRYGPLIKEDAANSARISAERCLRDSDVQSWLPLPGAP